MRAQRMRKSASHTTQEEWRSSDASQQECQALLWARRVPGSSRRPALLTSLRNRHTLQSAWNEQVTWEDSRKPEANEADDKHSRTKGRWRLNGDVEVGRLALVGTSRRRHAPSSDRINGMSVSFPSLGTKIWEMLCNSTC